MLDTFGDRLKLCRVLKNITAVNLVEKVNIKGIAFGIIQYNRWENDQVTRIRKKDAVEAIVEIYHDLGLGELSTEWLLNGTGIPPLSIDISNSLDEEKTFYLRKMLGKNYFTINVSGSYGLPFVSFGSHIIVQELEPEKCEGKISYIREREDSYNVYIGILRNDHDFVFIDNFNQERKIAKNEIKKCGKIVWMV